MTRGRRVREPEAASRPPQQYLELSDLLGYVGQVLGRGIPGAVWVRCELLAVTDRRHLYLELGQAGEDGQEVAKCRGTLWARERYALEGKFKRATGGGLSAGMKVLLLVTAELHPQYGFSLNVLDLSPEYTLGDLRLKLEGIRRTLDAEGLLERNRLLPEPADSGRVGVISPQNAAGLGDFRREADRLTGAVEFIYLEATFQGREAAASLLAALGSAELEHLSEPLDALVIIRGGGASSDLAWLNDLELARAVARFPVPVISGIGHARDDTILDEVACLRVDTPSKAAGLILGVVADGAARAEGHLRAIRAAAREALVGADAGSRWLLDRSLRAARQGTEAQARQLDATMSAVLGLTPARTLGRGYALVRGEEGGLKTGSAGLKPGERLTLEFADGMAGVRVEP